MANLPQLVFYKCNQAEQIKATLGRSWKTQIIEDIEEIQDILKENEKTCLIFSSKTKRAPWLNKLNNICVFQVIEKEELIQNELVKDWLRINMSKNELVIRIKEGFHANETLHEFFDLFKKAKKARDIQEKMNDRLLGISMELKNAKEQIEQLSQTDDLTKLKNRRYFDQQFERDLMQSKRYNTPLSAFILDIDNFKSINDTYGHQKGDEVLCEFAKIITKTKRDTDWAARYGGEEFFVVLPMTDIVGAQIIAERIRSMVEEKLSDIKNRVITTSIGLAQFESDHLDKFTYVEIIDKALYVSKTSGKNKVTYYCFKEKEYRESSSGKPQPNYR